MRTLHAGQHSPTTRGANDRLGMTSPMPGLPPRFLFGLTATNFLCMYFFPRTLCQNRFKDAISDFETALEIDPGHVNARKYLVRQWRHAYSRPQHHHTGSIGYCELE